MDFLTASKIGSIEDYRLSIRVFLLTESPEMATLAAEGIEKVLNLKLKHFDKLGPHFLVGRPERLMSNTIEEHGISNSAAYNGQVEKDRTTASQNNECFNNWKLSKGTLRLSGSIYVTMRNTPFIDSMEVKIVEVLWDVLDGVLADECQENDENLQQNRNSLAGCLYQR